MKPKNRTARNTLARSWLAVGESVDGMRFLLIHAAETLAALDAGGFRVVRKLKPRPLTHGKHSTYANGCRCPECRAAWRIYRQAERAGR